MSEHPKTVRCPECGHVVAEFFDHVAIDCEHDMTDDEIQQLLNEAAAPEAA